MNAKLWISLQINNLFEEFQSGFETQHTEKAQVKVTNGIIMASDNGLVSILDHLNFILGLQEHLYNGLNHIYPMYYNW